MGFRPWEERSGRSSDRLFSGSPLTLLRLGYVSCLYFWLQRRFLLGGARFRGAPCFGILLNLVRRAALNITMGAEQRNFDFLCLCWCVCVSFLGVLGL